MVNSRRLAKFAPALLLVALVLPSSAFGQATRTWVSGVGDDANPCSRTAPCKTFAGAISKTANGGEINAIDPGGFGGVTITKSITINGKHVNAGTLVSGTNAIVINATANDKVTIKGLDINGIGTGAQTSLSGIKILSAKTVRIIDNDIYRFKSGITSASTAATTRILVARNDIWDNGIGVIHAPGNNLITDTFMTLRNNTIHDNNCGVTTSALGTNASTPDFNLGDCGAGGAATGISKRTTTTLVGNGIHENGIGTTVRGSLGTNEFGNNDISGSSFCIRKITSGVVRTFGGNVLSNCTSNDVADSTVTPF